MILNLFDKKDNSIQAKSDINQNLVIRNEIEKISSLKTTNEKVIKDNELLMYSTIVETEDVLSQFDNDKQYNEKNYLKKYLEYKGEKSKIYNGVDCDVSLLCVVIYTLLNKHLNQEDIVNQYGSNLKYEIKNADERYKGDTLTLALHILKLYLGSLWKHIDSNKSKQCKKELKDFHALFQKVATTGIPVAHLGDDWCQYCYEHSDIIWSAMGEEAKLFLKNYNMFGNYMCIPGNSYKVSDRMCTSFNISRSNMGKWDTVDTLLCKIL